MFSTPTGTSTWEVMATLYATHTKAVHGGIGPAQTKSPVSAQKLAEQAESAFKQTQWDKYISQTTVKEQVKMKQLRAACDDDLLRRVYDAGDLASLDTEILLLNQVKKLTKPGTCKLCGPWCNHLKSL